MRLYRGHVRGAVMAIYGSKCLFLLYFLGMGGMEQRMNI